MAGKIKIPTIPWYVAIITALLAGFVGAVVFAGYVHIKVSPVQDPWTIVGILATLTGILAALLGVITALVAAFQWFVLDRRVDQRVEDHRHTLEIELQQFVRQRVQAIGELAISWTQPLAHRELVAHRVLTLAPDTPNLAPLMAWSYLQEVPLRSVLPTLHVSEGALEEQRHQSLEMASQWAQRALTTTEYHDAGYPEWVSALVAAWRKEPTTTVGYLTTALEFGFGSWDEVKHNDDLWEIITSATHGQDQLHHLDRLLALWQLRRPTREAVIDHCRQLDDLQRSHLWAVNRKTGHTVRITTEGLQLYPPDGEIKWRILSLPQLGGPSFDEMIDKLWEQVIPIRLLPGTRMRYTARGLTLSSDAED